VRRRSSRTLLDEGDLPLIELARLAKREGRRLVLFTRRTNGSRADSDLPFGLCSSRQSLRPGRSFGMHMMEGSILQECAYSTHLSAADVGNRSTAVGG